MNRFTHTVADAAPTIPRVSIIIVSWNTASVLLDCIRSIRRETSSTHEILVIDNASSDGTVAALTALFPDVRCIANNINRGFASANNQGLERATGRFVLLLNPDTLILDGAIDRCLDHMESDSTIACLGCQVLESATAIQRTCFRFPSLLNDLSDSLRLWQLLKRWPAFQGSWMPEWDRRNPRDVDVVSGMFMLVRRETVDRIGLLDESFFVYGEEADWCYRMHLAGLRRCFWPGARIMHLDGGGKSTSQMSVRMYAQLHRSQLIFFRKHYGRVIEVVLRLSNMPRLAARTLLGLVLISLGRAQRGWRIFRQSISALHVHGIELSPG